jgi:hypothetical protein
MAMAAVLGDEHLVGVVMKTCWAHREMQSWKQLWGVCSLWCDVWCENDQAWTTYFLNYQNTKMHWALVREKRHEAEMARLRVKLRELDEMNADLQEANAALRGQVWELQARNRRREIEDSRVVRQRVLKAGRPARVVGGAGAE